VPFVIYPAPHGEGKYRATRYSEAAASNTGLFVEKGYYLMKMLTGIPG